jgi:hypothetical protein
LVDRIAAEVGAERKFVMSVIGETLAQFRVSGSKLARS